MGTLSSSAKCIPIGAVMLLAFASTAGAHGKNHGNNHSKKPIVLEKTGGFVIGGKVVTIPSATPGVPTPTNRTLSCDHGYVEYFIPQRKRKTSLVMWHSSHTQVWQNRWDGGEGFKDMFLRRDYPVYLWDGPRVGRANWSCEPITYTPGNRDQGNFSAWKFGPAAPAGAVPTPSEWYPGVQFPTRNTQAWLDATRSRYDEFDIGSNVHLQSDVAAVAADSGRLGNQIVYLTNSAGGLRAVLTATKAKKNNIAGISTYESIGYVFPIGDPESPVACGTTGTNPNPDGPACAFGHILVPLENFKKLAKVKKIQFMWGDNRPETEQQVILSRLSAKLINKYGGNAEVVKMGDIRALKGSTHIPFADMHNDKVAEQLDGFLKKARLDGYAGRNGR